MQKKLALTLTVVLIVLTFASLRIEKSFSTETVGNLDIFTQKEPFSGKGANVFSDAFALGEDVWINALATYNKEPVPNILIAFEITGPRNPFENFTYYRAALTDGNGLASVNFRAPYSPLMAMGEWTVFGNAEICGLMVNDSVTFKVGWIVEIVSIRTMNWNHISQEQFQRGDYVGIELGLKTISMIEKTTYLKISVFDALNNPVSSIELNDFTVPPNETIVYAHLFLYIPRTAFPGVATAYACAYTVPEALDGQPYCPEVSKQFSIIPQRFFLSVKTAPIGLVAIFGEGWYEEGTHVNLTAPAMLTLGNNMQYTFSYWDIDGTAQPMGNNSITVLMDDNHTATAHYTQIAIYTLTIEATAGGNTSPLPGTYYHTTGAIVNVTAIPNARYIFVRWELDGVDVGSAKIYTVTMDGNHVLRAVFSPSPAGWFIPEWVFWPLLPLLILIILLLLILFFYMRRRKRAETSFYSGWTAWYYGYDLRRKPKIAKYRKT